MQQGRHGTARARRPAGWRPNSATRTRAATNNSDKSARILRGVGMASAGGGELGGGVVEGRAVAGEQFGIGENLFEARYFPGERIEVARASR